MRHVAETDLALYATHDLSWLRQAAVGLHVSHCPDCRARGEQYKADLERIKETAPDLPEGFNWDLAASEMAANIHVGLAAGECVARKGYRRLAPKGWRIAAIAAGFCALLISAWWLNMPASETAALGRAVKKVAQARPWGPRLAEEAGPTVTISSAGIELRQNGGVLGLTGVSHEEARPVSVTLSVPGSARARYIDSDTGQVTITSVYAQ
jgi:hypothetical protein